MVDAICSCADWDLSCSCEEDPNVPCELPADEEDEVGKSEQVQPFTAAAAEKEAAVADDDVVPAAAATATATPAAGGGAFVSMQQQQVGGSGPTAAASLSITELAHAAAIAAQHDPAALAARAAAFSDVSSALEKSATLLLALSDPCHPLVLEADRKLATASRQLHSGHLLH